MKATKILKFFSLIVISLALLVVMFPKRGIQVGRLTFRFPTMHQVLVKERQKAVVIEEEPERDLSGARDSLMYYHEELFAGSRRFWLPEDNVAFFDPFFTAAEQARQQKRVVRIMHYGDSQIEMDRITLRLRENLQEIFGGGGPGMVPLRQLVPTYSFNQSASGSLQCLSSWGTGEEIHSDAGGNYGPMLRSWRVTGSASVTLRKSNNREAMSRVKQFSKLGILFNNRGQEVSVNMKDKQNGGEYAEKCKQTGIHLITWNMDSATTSATITVQGTMDVYGILVDDGYGVAVDNIAMRGVSGQQFAKANKEQLRTAMSQIDVGMVIMQFGGNMMRFLKSEKAINDYCISLGKQIDIIHEVCPKAIVLFVGPADMATMNNGELSSYKQIPEVVERLRKMANEHNAAYWSMYDAMGGWNSMVAWKKEGLANADYIHFSTKGARLVGDYLSESLIKMYEFYQLRQQLTDEQFVQLWQSTTL